MIEVFLEILVEEKSMEVFLRGLLPRILPEGFILDHNCTVRAHNGKQDLQRKLPQTVRAYRHYPSPVILMVLQDQDSSDCRNLKQSLINLIESNNNEVNYLIRIVCRELENWYLGELDAVEQVYPDSKASRFKSRAIYRNPDIPQGSVEMSKMTKNFSKVGCARSIGQILEVNQNTSISFQHFVSGLNRLIASVSS